MPTELHCLLVGGINYWQGANVKCLMPAMDGSVTEALSQDVHGYMYRGGRNVTRVQRSVAGIQNKSVTGDMENRVGTKV